MSAPREELSPLVPNTCNHQLPPRMRVLFITNCEHLGSHLAEALGADKTTQVILERAVGATAGMSRLHEERFDAVLLLHDETSVDALEVLDALQASGLLRQPIIVFGQVAREQLEPYCFEAGADGYLSLTTATVRGLVWCLARAIQHHQMQSERQQWVQERRRQRQSQQEELDRLLAAHHRLAAALHVAADQGPHEPAASAAVADHYRELLRTVVMLGADDLSDELARFSRVVAQAGVSARQFLALHLWALESTIQDVGTRSAQRVLNRADLMALEVLVQLCEHYRQGLLDSLRTDSESL